MPHTASARPQPYQSRHNPLLHSGVVQTAAATGTVTVDLGLGHNNFVPALNIQGGATELADDIQLAWAYGTKKGTFTITVYKRPVAYGAWIADTVARNISFVAVAGAPAE